MRVTFVVPDVAHVPVGGIKVLYQHANHLARRGHRVTLAHLDRAAGSGMGGAARARRNIRFAAWRRGMGGWFGLEDGVEASLVDPDRPEGLPAGDVIVAGGWRTARLVHDAPPRAGARYHLIQGYMGDVEGRPGEVDDAWRLPMPRIVIARWLEEKCRSICGPDARVARIPAAVEDHFAIRTPIEARRGTTVSMLHHRAPWKGADVGLAALHEARQRRPHLDALLFGVQLPDRPLPSWVSWRLRPADLPAIHGRCAIHLHASSREGWPLVPAEAMASGSAVVAAGNEGVREYAVHERNALLADPGDEAGLAAALIRLIDDQELRIRLARQGVADMREHTWARASAALEAVLGEAGGGPRSGAP